jgi:hypothetical protein
MRRRLTLLLAVALTAGATLADSSTADASAWRIAPSPDLSGCGLADVTRVPGHSGLWAVGSCYTATPLFEHRSAGQPWTVVPAPAVEGSMDSELFRITAISRDDVWAIGAMRVGTRPSIYATLIEHWDGVSWTQVPSPSPGNRLNDLTGIVAASPTQIWAVGSSQDAGMPSVPLVLHWTGSRWGRVAVPTTRRSAFLSAVSLVPGTTNRLWAFGGYQTARRSRHHPLVLHRGARGWALSKPPCHVGNIFNDGIVVRSHGRGTVWAVGKDGLIERTTGSGWRIVATPDPEASFSRVVRIPGTSHLWAVGGNRFGDYTVSERWNGQEWVRIHTPGRNGLGGVVALSRREAWAVGGFGGIVGTGHALILHYR